MYINNSLFQFLQQLFVLFPRASRRFIYEHYPLTKPSTVPVVASQMLPEKPIFNMLH